MGTRSQLLLVVTLFFVAVSQAIAAPPQGPPHVPPPVRQIPGLTAADPFPRGCVDCHVKLPDQDMDVRLTTLMRAWQHQVDPVLLARVRAFTPDDIALEGKHPKVEVAGETIPKACLECHAATSTTAPPLGRLLHGLHLVGGAGNHFLSLFQGECTHCHKLDPATAVWSLGSGMEQ